MIRVALELKNPIRFGIISAAAITKQAFLPALKDISDATLTSIVDIDSEIIPYLSQKYDLGYIVLGIADVPTKI